MSAYLDEIARVGAQIQGKDEWHAINPEYAVRMQLQNRFKTGLEIAQYTADIMRRDMANYDADSSKYTQSLGSWHGFVAQQVMMSVKKHQQTTDRRYIYLSGWMVAALRSKFGPLPDQSMHEKTTVPELIEEIYTFLRQADARELRHIFAAWTKPARMVITSTVSLNVSTTTKPTWYRSSRISMPVSVTKKPPICWPNA